jgi:hypothetical protein
VQVENDAELAEMHTRLNGAALPVDEQIGTACCYARSDKYWTVDPQGMGNVPDARRRPHLRRICNASAAESNADASACCSPARGKPIGVPVKSSCC